MVTNFDWLLKKQHIDHEANKIKPNSSMQNELNRYGNKIVCLAYDEYRLTVSIIADKEHILNNFIRPNLTHSAFERCKFNMI